MIKLTSFWFDKMRNPVSPLRMAVYRCLSRATCNNLLYGSVLQFFLSREISKATQQRSQDQPQITFSV